ncbi:MAG: hypothetical protein II397_04685 [Treponema sp.]|nr:hypothetical protein [Treponema sp.]
MDNDFENEDDLEKEDKNKYFGRRVAITGGIIIGDLLFILNLAGIKITALLIIVHVLIGGSVFVILAYYLNYIRKKGNKIVVPIINTILLISYILMFVLMFLISKNNKN